MIQSKCAVNRDCTSDLTVYPFPPTESSDLPALPAVHIEENFSATLSLLLGLLRDFFCPPPLSFRGGGSSRLRLRQAYKRDARARRVMPLHPLLPPHLFAAKKTSLHKRRRFPSSKSRLYPFCLCRESSPVYMTSFPGHFHMNDGIPLAKRGNGRRRKERRGHTIFPPGAKGLLCSPGAPRWHSLLGTTNVASPLSLLTHTAESSTLSLSLSEGKKVQVKRERALTDGCDGEKAGNPL